MSCGGDCGCGSSCNCDGGSGCAKYLDISENTSTETIIAGVAPLKMFNEGSEMGYGAENDCKCGSNCSCDSCGCCK